MLLRVLLSHKKNALFFFALLISLDSFAGGPGSGRHKGYGKGSGVDGDFGILLFIGICVLIFAFCLVAIINRMSLNARIREAQKKFLLQSDKLLEQKQLSYEEWSEIKNNIAANGLGWAIKYVKTITDQKKHAKEIADAGKKREEEIAASQKMREVAINAFIEEGESLMESDKINAIQWNQLKIKVNSVDLVILQKNLSELQKERQREKNIEDFLKQNEAASASDEIADVDWREIKDNVNSMGIEWAKWKLEEAKEIKARHNNLIKKYGADKADKIFREDFFIGMTKEELTDSKGQPTKVEEDVMKTKTKETWIYGNKSSGDVFVFENELLVRFKDR
jgi:hypothetical protein